MSRQSSSVVVAAGIASGTYLLASQAFVGPMQPTASTNSLSSWTADPTTMGGGPGKLESGASSAVALLGCGGILAAVASTHRRMAGSRTQRRAEPVSTVAAVAAAAKAGGVAKAAAAAKGAAKVSGAVAGSAGAGSIKQAADGQPEDFDPELGGKRLSVTQRGTPEYKRAMEQKRARNTRAWEKYTGRNPDGMFGNPDNAGVVDDYDPFTTVGDRAKEDQRLSGFNVGDFDPALQIGVTEPLGYFDPLGFCKKGDAESFRQFRTAELKHGRVAMMGALGAVVQHYVKFPGFEQVPSGLDAVNSAPGSYGAIALFLTAGALELGVWTESPNKQPGNFGDPLGFDQYTEDMRNRELNNGRAAMFAVIGIIAAEIVTGKDAIEQLGGVERLVASPALS